MYLMHVTFNWPVCIRLNAHKKGNFVKNVSLLLYCTAVVGAEDGVSLLPVEQYAIVLLPFVVASRALLWIICLVVF